MAPAAQGPVALCRRPHGSAFGAGHGSLVGALAAKAAMETHGITGTIRFMGEPAEKVRGSKPIHAAKGYYDGLDAIISFHPFYMLPLCNTARWDTHCGPYYAAIYEFLCERPETWLQGCCDRCGGCAHSRRAHIGPRARRK
jgi:metal-dependent amidase/aminoacylase/carboxypeptidase family protein